MKSLRKFYSSIPLIIIGGLLIKLNFHAGEDDCGGFPELLMSFFLFIPFAAFLGLSLFRLKKNGEKFNYIPLVITGILMLLFTFFINWGSIFTHKTSLFAKNNTHARLSISLKDNGKFEIFVGLVEYGCTYGGQYILQHDTLIFERNVSSITDSSIANKYFVDYKKGLLYPIIKGKISTDSLKYFKIGKDLEY